MSRTPPPARRDPRTGVRVAIAHDYVTQRGGAERVVLAMLRAFPEAALHTTLYDSRTSYPESAQHEIHTSPLNAVGALRRDHRLALPLLAGAVGQMRIDADVVIASSSGWAHGIATTGRRVVYCYSPARWLYQSERYLGRPLRSSPQGWALAGLRVPLRVWDRRAARQAGPYLAISREVQTRIRDTYGLASTVVPAPHSMDPGAPQACVPALSDWSSGFHLVVSRLLPYKNVDAAVSAMHGRTDRLVVIGDGPLKDEVSRRLPSNVRLLSGLTDDQMRWVYAHATTLVAPSVEDYGLTPLEAGMFGAPTVALRGGGYLDTITEGVTGLFFDEPTPQAITAALDARARHTWEPSTIRQHASTFNETAFAATLRESIRSAMGGAT